ncbi:hypothetical protein C8F01DRAFT_1235920 [Mycena amicta]|nr:hypothetical protein C8F01DRAFT_1235920 [Mycena amicta]
MRGVVCAVAVGRTKTGALLVDPDEDEESSLNANGCFAFAFGHGPADARCVWTNWRTFGGTTFGEDELRLCEQLAHSAARSVWLRFRGEWASRMTKKWGLHGCRQRASLDADSTERRCKVYRGLSRGAALERQWALSMFVSSLVGLSTGPARRDSRNREDFVVELNHINTISRYLPIRVETETVRSATAADRQRMNEWSRYDALWGLRRSFSGAEKLFMKTLPVVVEDEPRRFKSWW